MNWELVIILAMPAAVAAFIIWMIAAGHTKTGAIPPDTEPNPYPERLDTLGRWIVGIATAILYVIIAVTIGPLAAAMVFAFLLLIDAVGALIWTVGQEIFARRRSEASASDQGQVAAAIPFGTRLVRNFRDFYANIVIGILAYG